VSGEDVLGAAIPLIAGLLGLLGGVISARLTARSKLRELQEQFELAEQAREREARARTRLVYLEPLRIAAVDLLDRLEQTFRKLDDGDELVRRSLGELPAKRADAATFADWANHAGHYALSSLYITAVYLARASRIRTELPFVQLGTEGDRNLLGLVGDVRTAVGGEFGIWDGLQDSLGGYVMDGDGAVMNYREFCTELFEPTTASWYRRLVEFWGDLHLKTHEERERMAGALTALTAFLASEPGAAR
jgi:hypothetical protein